MSSSHYEFQQVLSSKWELLPFSVFFLFFNCSMFRKIEQLEGTAEAAAAGDAWCRWAQPCGCIQGCLGPAHGLGYKSCQVKDPGGAERQEVGAGSSFPYDSQLFWGTLLLPVPGELLTLTTSAAGR